MSKKNITKTTASTFLLTVMFVVTLILSTFLSINFTSSNVHAIPVGCPGNPASGPLNPNDECIIMTDEVLAVNYCRAKVGVNPIEPELANNNPNIPTPQEKSTICVKGYLAGVAGSPSKTTACTLYVLASSLITERGIYVPEAGAPSSPTVIPSDPFGDSQPTTPTPTVPNATRMQACKKAYNAGKTEQVGSANQAQRQSQEACNNTDPTKKEQCREDLRKCNHKPNGQKLECYQKLITNYPAATIEEDEDKPVADCDTKLLNPLSWIICPIIDIGANGSDAIFRDIIKPLLSDIPLSTDPGDDFFRAWQGFRFIANLILVGGMLGIVYSMARGDK